MLGVAGEIDFRASSEIILSLKRKYPGNEI